MHSKTRHAGASAAASSKSGVTVALQLLSGERLIADFLPDGNLKKKVVFIFQKIINTLFPKFLSGISCFTGKLKSSLNHL